MINLFYLDLLLGYATSIVPTNVISNAYHKNLSNGENVTDLTKFDYIGALRNIPLIFAVINVIVMFLIDYLYVSYRWNPNTRFVVAGIIITLIYSNFGRYIVDIPPSVLKITDPNMFTLYALILWIIVYFLVYYIRDTIECRYVNITNIMVRK
jgi:hypothetical protein